MPFNGLQAAVGGDHWFSARVVAGRGSARTVGSSEAICGALTGVGIGAAPGEDTT